MQKLYDANQEHADEVRAKHVRDIFVDGYWELATRGEKLRTCAAHRPIYTSKQTKADRKAQLYSRFILEGSIICQVLYSRPVVQPVLVVKRRNCISLLRS
jgi:hypothetical protein